MPTKQLESNECYQKIKELLEESRNKIYQQVNFVMVHTYWNVGKIILEEEQQGEKRAEYGKYLVKGLAKKLTHEFGKGFDERNLFFMKQFYRTFPKVNALRSELSWTHYRQLLRVDNDNARSFYLTECAESRWSTRELDRQINSMLFERLALSKDKKGVKALAENGHILELPEDAVKDPYILEFLGWPEHSSFSEKDLETAIIDNLQHFLLELGKGFTFVARQKRITLDNEHFYIDLVFYNRQLRSFVLIDLKIGKLTHQDLGQMQMYVNYFDRDVKADDENKTIGIVLCRDKKEIIAKYTLPKDNKTIFASKYKTYLPTEEELKHELKEFQQKL